jgi:hypothetical protein
MEEVCIHSSRTQELVELSLMGREDGIFGKQQELTQLPQERAANIGFMYSTRTTM